MKIGDKVRVTTRQWRSAVGREGIIVPGSPRSEFYVRLQGDDLDSVWIFDETQIELIKKDTHVCSLICKKCLKNPRKSVML